MTRRPLTWIAATAAVLGVVVGGEVPTGAVDPLWIVTIDSPAEGAVSRSRGLVVEGTATNLVSRITVTAVPTFDAPPSCGEPVSASGPVADGRYQVPLAVACNGPYTLEAVAHDGLGSSGSSETRAIAVEEAPVAPAPPNLDGSPGGGVVARWPASTDPDAVGWSVMVGSVEVALPAEARSHVLPPEHTYSFVALRAVRWGAAGPGGPTVSSPSSGEGAWGGGQARPPVETGSNEVPPPVSPGTEPLGTEPLGTDAPPSTAGPGTTPPPSSGPGVPSRGRGSGAARPEGATEELPPGVPDDAFVPGAAPRPASVSVSVSDGGTETASASAPAGFVRIDERRSPGLVAPFAIAVMMLAIAAHIAWYLRRSRPRDPGRYRSADVVSPS